MRFLLLILALAACTLNPTPTTLPPTAAPPIVGTALVATWVDGAGLFAWEEDGGVLRITEGGVIRPYLSPHGERIAFTRGAQGQPQSLWVANRDGSGVQELVAPDRLEPYREGVPLIDSVAWLDDETILFNTAQAYPTAGIVRQNDLYRVNLVSRGLSQLFPRDEGGAFTISPDGQHIAIVTPGTFGSVQGRITLLDPTTLRTRELLAFEGATTQDDDPFYPPVSWSPDSSALRVAIPEWDRVYTPGEVDSRTELWWLGVDEPSRVTGVVLADLFGAPRWSHSASHTAYLQFGGDSTLDLILADANGGTPTVIATGTRDTLTAPHWLPNVNRFVYTLNSESWFASTTGEKVPFEGDAMSAVFTQNGVVYATSAAAPYELRYIPLYGYQPDSLLIATVSQSSPVFDARSLYEVIND